MRHPVLLSVLLALAVPRGPWAADPEQRDRSLLTLEGRVIAVESVRLSDAREWLDAVLEPPGQAAARVRVAPVDVLEASDFRIAAGQTLQVQVFSDESPFGVQRVRNRDTGRVLRLRCLHGEPLWDARDPSRGAGPGGRRRADPGGPRYRGGR